MQTKSILLRTQSNTFRSETLVKSYFRLSCPRCKCRWEAGAERHHLCASQWSMLARCL